jgi:phenylalanyl-tRNA synthetase alpha chain
MQEDINRIRNEFMALVMDATTSEEIEALRIRFLGRNGAMAHITKGLANLSIEQKKEAGKAINETKTIIENALIQRTDEINNTNSSDFDHTVPGIAPQIGHKHIATQAIEEISKVFTDIGFVRRRYQEVEWDWYAFTALNFSENHPARDEWETFLISEKGPKAMGGMILTPHTSSGQVREMQKIKTPPIRMINISKTYRRQSDVSHVPMFHQFEGLVVDEGINITHLMGTLDYFMKTFYGSERKYRIRPYNFPFTEPSFEIDIICSVCNGKGCRLCKAGWLELGGAGMVHPNVLKAGEIDPVKYKGYAFGWGVERAFMMKANLWDIRMIYSNDSRFLKQF